MRSSSDISRITGIVAMLAVFTLPGIATYFCLQHARHQVRKEVKARILAGLDRDALVVLSFSTEENNALEWEHAREFRYAGHMYDVIGQEQDGDRFTYWCWRDDAETHLNRQMEQLIARTAGKSPVEDSHSGQLVDFFRTLYVTHLPPIADDLNALIESSHCRIRIYSSPYIKQHDHPPEYV